MKQDVLNYLDQKRDFFVQELVEILKIPSISAKPEHKADLERAAERIRQRLDSLGFRTECYQDNMHPLIYGERWDAPGKPTVLFYGHYDVQPPEPLELWVSGPFQPRIENGRIYARGASDDKGQVLAQLNCFEAFAKTAGRLPVNVKILIEGEEEIGSPNLRPWVQQHRDKLACDCAVITDTAMWAEGVPALCYGLRGLVGLEIQVRGANRDLHSGSYGGVVPNPINELCRLVARLKDDKGRIAVPGIYDDVKPVREWEREAFSQLEFDEEDLIRDLGLKSLTGEAGFSTLEQRWARPTLDVNGIMGGYQGPGSKTVIPSSALAKITMRIVPEQEPEKVIRQVTEYIKAITPPYVEVTVTGRGGSPAVLLPTQGPVMEAAKAAFRHGFGREPVLIRDGASIPVVGTFASCLQVPCVLLGFGLPDDNLHSPNEKFNLDNYHRGSITIAHFLDLLAGSAKEHPAD